MFNYRLHTETTYGLVSSSCSSWTFSMPAKRRPETLWKLVEARCAQLADSVSGARIAFLIALSWSFIWAWSLYSADLGYLIGLRDRYAYYYINSMTQNPSKEITDWCALNSSRVMNNSDLSGADKNKFCSLASKSAFEWVDKAYRESTILSFPGGFGKLHVSDLGIIGQIGMLVILLWLFFAARRENHAIRAIVDMDRDARRRDNWFPQKYILYSQDEHLSAEHVAYAYHSIAQRFVFIFSHHTRPLLALTVLLLFIPAIVSLWNFATDVRDLIARFLQPLNVTNLLRTVVEAFLVACVFLTTIRIVRAELGTSVLLNGWYLAARDVWMDQWDETTLEPAPPATIHVPEQKAEVYTGEDRR
jgi:hypothetical protein